jgi:hypothetical protein
MRPPPGTPPVDLENLSADEVPDPAAFYQALTSYDQQYGGPARELNFVGSAAGPSPEEVASGPATPQDAGATLSPIGRGEIGNPLERAVGHVQSIFAPNPDEIALMHEREAARRAQVMAGGEAWMRGMENLTPGDVAGRIATGTLNTLIAPAGEVAGGPPIGGTDVVTGARQAAEEIPGVAALNEAAPRLPFPGSERGLSPLDVAEGAALATIPPIPGERAGYAAEMAAERLARAGGGAAEKAEPLARQIFGPRGRLLSTVSPEGKAVIRTGEDAAKYLAEISPETQARLPNLMRLKVGDDIKASIIRTAEENPEVIDAARQGVVSHEQTIAGATDLAEQLGLSQADFLKSPIGKAWNNEEQTLLRAYLIRKHADMQPLVTRIADEGMEGLSDLEKFQVRNDMLDLMRLQAVERGGAATAGRALESRKIVMNAELAQAITGNAPRWEAVMAKANAEALAEAAAGRAAAMERAISRVEAATTPDELRIAHDELRGLMRDANADWSRRLRQAVADQARAEREAGRSRAAIERDFERTAQRESEQASQAIERAGAEAAAGRASPSEGQRVQTEAESAARAASREAEQDWERRSGQLERMRQNLRVTVDGKRIAPPRPLTERELERIADRDLRIAARKEQQDADQIARAAAREADSARARVERSALTDQRLQVKLENQARKVLEKMGQSDGITDEMIEQWARLQKSGDALAATRMLKGMVDPGWWRRAQTLRIASMLSSTTTHTMQAVSNVLNLGMTDVDKVLAAGIDALLPGARATSFAEIGPMLSGQLRVGPIAGWRSATTVMREGFTPAEAGRLDQPVGFGAEHISVMGKRPFQGKVAAGVDLAAEGPIRLLVAGDEVVRSMSYAGEVMRLATRQAVREGLAGAQRASRAREIMENLTENPALMKEAEANAKRVVFQEDRPLPRLLAGARTSVPYHIGELFGPQFIRTPYNVVAQGMERNVTGWLHTIELARKYAKMPTADLATKLAAREQMVEQAARATMGTAMFGTGIALGSLGFMTLARPMKESEQNALPPGWQPWSLRVGENYISLPQLGNIALPLAFGAVLADVVQHAPNQPAVDVLGRIRQLGDISVRAGLGFMQDMQRTMEAITQMRAEPWLENLASQRVPYGALDRRIEQALGMAPRDPHGALDALYATVPFLAERVIPQRDVTGEERQPGLTGPAALLSPMNVTQERDNPALSEIRRLGISLGDLDPNVNALPANEARQYGINAKLGLEPQELDLYRREAGRMAFDLMGRMVADPEWSRLSDYDKARYLQQAIERSRERARNKVREESSFGERAREGLMTEAERQRQLRTPSSSVREGVAPR